MPRDGGSSRRAGGGRAPVARAGAPPMNVPGIVTVVAIVLFLWGVITLVRRIAESEGTGGPAGGRTSGRGDHRTSGRADQRTRGPSGARDDDIDWEELRGAEDEVRDLGTQTRPEDGWEGDDWGPGAPKREPPGV